MLRLLDDKIIYRLNKSIPTTSFAGEVNAESKCKELYKEVGALSVPIFGLGYVLLSLSLNLRMSEN